MNEESHNPFSDRELEARIVALVLGEASDFERDELNRLIEERPELATLKDQIQSVHGLLRDVGVGESLTDDDDWKLPTDKRSAVLAVIGGDAEQQSAKQTLNKLAEKRRSVEANSFLWTLTKIAAVVCFVALPASLAILAFSSYRSLELATNAADSRDSNDVSGALWLEDSAAPSAYVLPNDAGFTAADEKYLRTVEPATVAEVDSKKNSKSALSAIRDSLEVDAIVTMPNDDEGPSSTISLDGDGLPSPDLDFRFDTERSRGRSLGAQRSFSVFDSGSASTDGVNGPESPTLPTADNPALVAKEEAEQSDDFDGDGNRLTDSQPTVQKAGNGELSFPKFAGRTDELNALDPAEPVRSTTSVADEGTVLLGGIKRFAEGRSEPGVSGEPELSSPMTHEYAESDSGGETLDAARERDEGFDDQPASDGRYVTFGFRSEDRQLWGDVLDAGEDKNTDGFVADGESLGGGLGGFGGAGMGLADERRNVMSAEHKPQDKVGSGVRRVTRDIKETAPSQSMAAGKGDRPETTEGAYYDARIRAKAPLGNKNWDVAGDLLSDDNGKGIDHFSARRRSERIVEQDGSLPQRGQPTVAGESRWYQYVPPVLEGDYESMKKARVKRTSAPAGLNEKTAEGEAFSTFSLYVSDVSFKLARAALAQGEWPEAAKVRIEEFVNAFDYGDPMPSKSEGVACYLEQSTHPFLQQRNLLRVSMRTAAAGRSSNTPLRLTLLLDNSGSMERIDRQQTVRRALALLAQQLKPIDQVTLISFARQPRLLADKVSGAQSHQLVQLTHNLPSEGGTNIEAALQLAFEKAQEQQIDGAQNRIILLTDGAVNLGDANAESLSQMVTTMRNAGIAFDAAGISAEGLNDEILEALTRKGDGRYYLLDSLEAADEGFARQIAGALRPSAKNVKVQVEFNPKRVGRYKLLGFEKHRLKQEDFRNDKVDAAEMAAAEAGVAMYQFEAKPDGEGDVGSVSVRFRDLSTGRMIENRWPIPYEAGAPRPDQAAPSLRIAISATLLAAKLRGEPLGATVDLKTLSDLIAGLPDPDRNVRRVQQLQLMIQQARQMSGN